MKTGWNTHLQVESMHMRGAEAMTAVGWAITAMSER